MEQTVKIRQEIQRQNVDNVCDTKSHACQNGVYLLNPVLPFFDAGCNIYISEESAILVNNLMTAHGSLIVFILHAFTKPSLSDFWMGNKSMAHVQGEQLTIHFKCTHRQLSTPWAIPATGAYQRFVLVKLRVSVTLDRVKILGVCFWDFQGI